MDVTRAHPGFWCHQGEGLEVSCCGEECRTLRLGRDRNWGFQRELYSSRQCCLHLVKIFTWRCWRSKVQPHNSQTKGQETGLGSGSGCFYAPDVHRAATLPLRGSASALSQGAAPTLASPSASTWPQGRPQVLASHPGAWTQAVHCPERKGYLPDQSQAPEVSPRSRGAWGTHQHPPQPAGRWLFLLFLRAWRGPDVLTSQGG